MFSSVPGAEYCALNTEFRMTAYNPASSRCLPPEQSSRTELAKSAFRPRFGFRDC